MAWFAWLGVMTVVTLALSAWVQNPMLTFTGWMTTWIVGFIGTVGIGYESARNVRRYRFLAIGRPRYYFELSRSILASGFLIVAPLVTLAICLPMVIPQAVNVLDLILIAGVLATAFFATTIAGYVVSLLTGRKRRGRAYECASWFLVNFGGIALAISGFITIPDPPKGIREALPGMIACGVGLVLFVGGLLAEVTRSQHAK